MKNLKDLNNKVGMIFIAHYYTESIDMFYSSTVEANSNLKDKFDKDLIDIIQSNNLSEEELELIHHSRDKLCHSEQTIEFAGEMMIVALYKTIEMTIKNMLEFSSIFSATEMNNFSYASELKKKVKNKICDMETLNGYNAYNELRLINNCIKHSGKVSNDLFTSNQIWKKHEKLQNLDEAYFRLKDDVKVFVNSLRDNILEKMGITN